MLCIHIYFIWVLYLPLNLCLSMPTKSRHISLKCQLYSVCECLSVCKCVCVCALRMWRHHKNEQEHHRNGIAIKYIMKTWMVYIKCDIRMKWMTNDLWRSISSRFLVFASILYITLPTRFNSLFFSHCTLHLPYSVLQLNYIIVIAFILFMYICVSLGCKNANVLFFILFQTNWNPEYIWKQISSKIWGELNLKITRWLTTSIP